MSFNKGEKPNEVVNSFINNKQSLVDKLNSGEDTESKRKRREILESFTLDEGAFKQYARHVYTEADDESIGSCSDVLGPGGINTVYGMLSNIAANFEHMETMADESSFHKFDARAEAMLTEGRHDDDRFNYVINSINSLHSDGKYSPNIEEPSSKSNVVENLRELEEMLNRLSPSSN